MTQEAKTMPGARYTRADQNAYFRMLAVVVKRWVQAIGRPDYRNTTGWNLLTQLWREGLRQTAISRRTCVRCSMRRSRHWPRSTPISTMLSQLACLGV